MVSVFLLALIISYLGSIPPGTINITVMQYAVQGHKRAALFFILAVSLIEFVYAGLTVRFQMYLSESELLMDHFLIITAVGMIILGGANLFTRTSSKGIVKKVHVKGRNGFARGLIVAILNPLTVPFWLAVTAYLQNRNLIDLSGVSFWVYLLGISLGTVGLLITVRSLGAKFTRISDNQFLVHILPGLTFLVLGLINLYDWLF